MELVEGIDFLEFVCPDPTRSADETLGLSVAPDAERSTSRTRRRTPGPPAVAPNPPPAATAFDPAASSRSPDLTDADLTGRSGRTDPMPPPDSPPVLTDVDPDAPRLLSPGSAAPESTIRAPGSEIPLPAATEVEPVAPVTTLELAQPAARRPDFARLRSASAAVGRGAATSCTQRAGCTATSSRRTCW